MKNNILALLLKMNTLFVYSLVYWKLRLVWVLWLSFFLTVFKKNLHFFFNYNPRVSPLLFGSKRKTVRLKLFLLRGDGKAQFNFCSSGFKPSMYFLENLIQVQ